VFFSFLSVLFIVFVTSLLVKYLLAANSKVYWRCYIVEYMEYVTYIKCFTLINYEDVT